RIKRFPALIGEAHHRIDKVLVEPGDNLDVVFLADDVGAPPLVVEDRLAERIAGDRGEQVLSPLHPGADVEPDIVKALLVVPGGGVHLDLAEVVAGGEPLDRRDGSRRLLRRARSLHQRLQPRDLVENGCEVGRLRGHWSSPLCRLVALRLPYRASGGSRWTTVSPAGATPELLTPVSIVYPNSSTRATIHHG